MFASCVPSASQTESESESVSISVSLSLSDPFDQIFDRDQPNEQQKQSQSQSYNKYSISSDSSTPLSPSYNNISRSYSNTSLNSLHSFSPTLSLSQIQPSNHFTDLIPQESSDNSLLDSDCKFSESELLHTRTVLISGVDISNKRDELREYFHQTFSLYEKLFSILESDTVYYQQPDKLRHPLVFYYGHTAVFFVNKLRLGKYISAKGVNAAFESLCAVGVDEMSWDDLNSCHYDWPTISSLRVYRDQVRCLVDNIITSMTFTLPIQWNSPAWIILMGCEHERIHLETSSVLFRQLPINAVRQHSMFKICSNMRTKLADVPKNSLLAVPAGNVILGRSFHSPIYGWDCDYSSEATNQSSVSMMNEVDPGFLASKYVCSNAEFYQFMVAGGYSDQQWWGEEGWAFVTYRQATHPVFWVPVDRDAATGEIVYRYRALHTIIDMPWDWPVDVNYIEAKAWCNWKSAQTKTNIRLPTESEWTRLRNYCLPDPLRDDQPYWSKAPGNLNLEYYASSCPIDEFSFAHGFCDVIGNVWQHTETPVSAYKGFRFHPLYDDFSVPTFDTRHNCIKGGSWISTGNEATREARYAFRRHFYQHAGFRYVQSEVQVSPPDEQTQLNETDPAVCTYIDSHYSSSLHSTFSLPNSSVVFSSIALSALRLHRSASLPPASRAVDIGCAAGRTVFELAKSVPYVLGLDNTTRYIRIGSRLQQEGCVQYVRKSEGELEAYGEVDMSQLGLNEVRDRVEFMQADACNLDSKYTDFDLVLACNLIEYLYSPSSFLANIHTRIRNGGLLILASSYKWDTLYTPKEQWLGGVKESGESVNSMERVEQILVGEGKFVRVTMNKEEEEVMCVTRNTDRSFTVNRSQVTVWKRVENRT